MSAKAHGKNTWVQCVQDQFEHNHAFIIRFNEWIQCVQDQFEYNHAFTIWT
jgi:hypothetical protein